MKLVNWLSNKMKILGWNVCLYFRKLPMCCGILEIGYLDEWSGEESSASDELDRIQSFGETREKAWLSAWSSFTVKTKLYLRDAANFPVTVNFVRRREDEGVWEDDFEAATLRVLVETQKLGEAQKVYSWINPNTGNIIEQWLIKNGSTEV